MYSLAGAVAQVTLWYAAIHYGVVSPWWLIIGVPIGMSVQYALDLMDSTANTDIWGKAVGAAITNWEQERKVARHNLSYQQMRLMEQISNAARGQYTYVVAPIDAADASVCAAAGLLNVSGTGSAELTEAGRAYIIELNIVTRQERTKWPAR